MSVDVPSLAPAAVFERVLAGVDGSEPGFEAEDAALVANIQIVMPGEIAPSHRHLVERRRNQVADDGVEAVVVRHDRHRLVAVH